jgi:hypothetical protein
MGAVESWSKSQEAEWQSSTRELWKCHGVAGKSLGEKIDNGIESGNLKYRGFHHALIIKNSLNREQIEIMLFYPRIELCDITNISYILGFLSHGKFVA